MKIASIMGIAVALGIGGVSQTHAAVVGDSLGNSGPLPVHKSWDGNQNSVESLLWGMGGKDGNNQMLVISGANADQVRYQRFGITDYQTQFTFKLLGGVAAYQNTFGIYTYDIDAADPLTAPLSLTPLFTRHDDPLGSVVELTIDPGQYLGFYLVADGGNSPKGTFYSETARNSGLDSTQHHFLMLDSIVSGIAGYTIAVEDLPYNTGTGLMGDSDYNDLFVQMRFEQIIPPPVIPDNDPIATPEPASMGLALMGLTALTLRATRRRRDR